MKIGYVVSGIVTALLGVSACLGKRMADQLTSAEKSDVERERIEAVKRGEYNKEDLENVSMESFSIENKRNEVLRGEILYCDTPTEKVCVACHGWTSSRIGMYKYARAILDNGFHMVVYDHINCGSSDGKYGSMGFRESQDLEEVITYVKQRFGEHTKILTYGESMGSATVLLHMTKDTRVDAVVADCPFASLEEQCAYSLKSIYHLPKQPILFFTDLIFYKRLGVHIADVNPYRAIQQADGVPDIPLLLMHGTADKFILPSQSEKIASVKKGFVRLRFMEGGIHARSILKTPDEYRAELHAFLQEVLE